MPSRTHLKLSLMTVLSLLAVSPLGLRPAGAADRQRPTKPPDLGPAPCRTCCCSTTPGMVAREKRYQALPKKTVLDRRRTLLSYKTLSDGEAMAADILKIRERSFAATRLSARGMRGPAAQAAADGRSVAGFIDARVPNAFGGYLAKNGLARKHGPWHAIHNAARLSAAELKFVEQVLGWKAPRDRKGNLIKQEGMPESGYKFLGMHGGMAQGLIQAGVDGGKIRAFTKAEWEQLEPSLRARSPGVADGMAMVMEMLQAYDQAVAAGTAEKPAKTKIGDLFTGYRNSTDIFGNWMQTTQLRADNAKRLTRLSAVGQRTVERTAGLHNLVHVVLANPSSDMDMGNPDLNLYNELFWLHHGTIEKAKQVFLKWYATPADRAAYAKVEADEIKLMSPGPQGQRMLRTINRVDAKTFSANERAMWRRIQSKISPATIHQKTGKPLPELPELPQE